jgi:hypothetical protein
VGGEQGVEFGPEPRIFPTSFVEIGRSLRWRQANGVQKDRLFGRLLSHAATSRRTATARTLISAQTVSRT